MERKEGRWSGKYALHHHGEAISNRDIGHDTTLIAALFSFWRYLSSLRVPCLQSARNLTGRRGWSLAFQHG